MEMDMALNAVNATPNVGSELRINKADLLSGTYADEIAALLEARSVVFARGLEFSDEDLHTLAATLGDIRLDGKDGRKKDSLMKVTFDKKHSELTEYFWGTFTWHFDGAWEDVPPRASVLTPRVLAPTGGETEFINTYAAYDALPDDRKRQLDGLMTAHTMVETYRRIVDNPTEEQIRDWRGYGEKIHPLIWHHRSGLKSIALSNSTEYVVSMDRAESDELLKWLADWVEQRRFVYTHVWQMGDVLIWNNTGTMHRAAPYDVDSGRRLHRVTLQGVEPLAAEMAAA
ncbi:MAG: TauD/TfdA family dioxygenase [Sphingomonadales bacterium]|nr:MAG: TauD/TfdA family dioxygenase [Sphingomonadales bacterium]